MSYLVILDAGHGLNTSGKRTPPFDDGTVMYENAFNRDIVRRIDSMLESENEVDVFFTTTEKRDIHLDERVGRVNQLYEKVKPLYDKIVLVSVHANAMKDYWNDIGNGTATFHYPGNEVDEKFAEVIQKNLIAKTGLKPHRGGVVAADFQIIRDVSCTACLCECAFMDNKEEAKLLISDDFRQACAEGIVNGLKEYFGIKKEVDNMEYKKYNDRIHELKSNVEELDVKIVDKKIFDITEYTNCTNGTFYWYDDKGKTYPTSILYADNTIYQNLANHYLRFNAPQSVFIVYKNDTVDMKRIKSISELKLDDIRLVVGGLGLRNTLDTTFKYSPVTEGFKGLYADVLRKTNKTVLGYNKRLNKVYLLTVKNATHGELLDIVSDNSTGEAYDLAISLDGGGSTFMDANKEYVFEGQDSRRINNIIGFNLD
jgi:N-acetylmuramoyl-L-alanine amidase